jgi:hypothetical protein
MDQGAVVQQLHDLVQVLVNAPPARSGGGDAAPDSTNSS